MLNVDGQGVEIKGKRIDLMAEYTSLTNSLIKMGVLDDDDLKLCIELAKKSEEELAENAEKAEKWIKALFAE